MSIAKTNIVNSFSEQVKSLQTKINTAKAEMASGQKLLTVDQQSTVANLSTKVKSFSTPQDSIKAAKNTIDVAQTAMKSILPLLSTMQRLASQATDPSLSASDSTSANFRFQKLVTEIGKLATGARLNGTNLLSGTAGMNVVIGTDKTAASRSFVNGVDIYGMMTMGLLSSIKIDTPANAQSAMGALQSALAQITNGQFSLKLTSTRLDAQATKLTGLAGATQSNIDSLQKVDIKKLNAQLTQLQSEQNIRYQLISQLDPAAYRSLKTLTLISSS